MDIFWLLAAMTFFAASYGLIWFLDRLGTER